jgi:UDP:flavonoid glycosyltransferase YjiC (YdhE family)
MARIAFSWEIGAGRGHVGPMLPVATGLAARGHAVHAFLRQTEGLSDMAGAEALRIFPAPRWLGEVIVPAGLNVGELLLNFGFHSRAALSPLVNAWRDRLAGANLLVSNVAPAAVVAARTLGLPYLEMSQGFHIPPVSFPAAPFRDWVVAPRRRLEIADRRVLDSINAVLSNHAAPPIATIGDLFVGHLALLTYPELEMYPERGSSEYFGIMPPASHRVVDWPEGEPRLLAYLNPDYRHLPALLEAIGRCAGAAVVVCPGIDAALAANFAGGATTIVAELLDFPRMARGAHAVVCHASHQTTADALLEGRPTLLLPIQVEQFSTMRRVVRYGAGLGVLHDVEKPDFERALTSLLESPQYAARAQAFAARYRGHNRSAALRSLIERCERLAALTISERGPPQIHILAALGGRNGARALNDLLAPHAAVREWAIEALGTHHEDAMLEQGDAAGARFPSGGTLIVLGGDLPLGDWLARAWYERTILVHGDGEDANRQRENERRLRVVSGRSETIDLRRATAGDVLDALRARCLDATG